MQRQPRTRFFLFLSPKQYNNMKIKGTFLSYISEEKRLRKEQNRVLRNSSKSKKSSLEDPIPMQTDNNGAGFQIHA
jgi:hypothetical protein